MQLNDLAFQLGEAFGREISMEALQLSRPTDRYLKVQFKLYGVTCGYDPSKLTETAPAGYSLTKVEITRADEGQQDPSYVLIFRLRYTKN